MCSPIPEISFEFDKAVNLVVELPCHLKNKIKSPVNCHPVSFPIHHVPWSLMEIIKFSSIGAGCQSVRLCCV